jgi:molecular chaperone DnaK (HSP70)
MPEPRDAAGEDILAPCEHVTTHRVDGSAIGCTPCLRQRITAHTEAAVKGQDAVIVRHRASIEKLVEEKKDLTARLAAAEGALAEYRREHEKCIEEIQAEQLTLAEHENELHDEKDRTIAALKAAVEQALQRVLTSLSSAADERFARLGEWRQESERWKADGDMYGWNFFQGMASGANWADILYQRIGREVTAIRTERAALTSPPVKE